MRTEFFTTQKTALASEKEPQIFNIVGDVAGDTSTEVTISIGETLSTAIEILGDRDYFAITLTEGQAITISVNSIAIGATINFRDANDQIIATSSSLLIGDQTLSAVALDAGTYYIDVSAALGLGLYDISVFAPDKAVDDEIDGTEDDDILRGYDGNDIIAGRGGNDTIFGGDDSDRLEGGIGDDVLHGERGGDVLLGGFGNDTLYGGDGPDYLGGNMGLDTIYGGIGDDIVDAGGGADTVFGGGGHDFIEGGYGRDTLHGEGGNDVIRGGAGEDLIYGNFGADILTGGDNSDVIYGGEGGDYLGGGRGEDFLYGGKGADYLEGGNGMDTLHGGLGDDKFVLDGIGGPDTIVDFEARDTIVLKGDAFLAIGVTGILPGINFTIGAAAGSIFDRVIYNQDTGELFYDPDGTGSEEAILVAFLEPGTELDASQIEVDYGSPIFSEPLDASHYAVV